MATLSIKTSDDTTLFKLINLAINNKLFEENWSLADDYVSCLLDCHLGKRTNSYRVAIGFINDRPVAICFIKNNEVQFYTKPHYRRRGYASSLFKHLVTLSSFRKLLVARKGNDASAFFFLSQGIKQSA